MAALGRYIKRNGKDYEECDWNPTRAMAMQSGKYTRNKGCILIHEIKDKKRPGNTIGWVTYKPIQG